MLRDLVRKAGVNAKFRTSGSGAEIHLLDVDSKISIRGAKSKAEAEKLRGAKITCVVVDECASFDHEVFEYLLFDILEPALQDSGGTLYCTGTPGNLPVGLFYEITTDSPGWSRHHWDYTTNTAVEGLVERVEATRVARGWSETHPTWQKEYKGVWTIDSTLLVLPGFRLYKNSLSRVDRPDTKDGQYVGGIYLDYSAGATVIVGQTSPKESKIVFTAEEHLETTDLEEVANVCSQMEDKYPGVTWKARLDKRFGPLVTDLLSEYYDVVSDETETRKLHDLVVAANSELSNGNVIVHPDMQLTKEWKMLQWADSNKKEFAPEAPSQFTHAFLGLFEDNLHRQTAVTSPTQHQGPSLAYYEKLFSGELSVNKPLPSFLDLEERKF